VYLNTNLNKARKFKIFWHQNGSLPSFVYLGPGFESCTWNWNSALSTALLKTAMNCRVICHYARFAESLLVMLIFCCCCFCCCCCCCCSYIRVSTSQCEQAPCTVACQLESANRQFVLYQERYQKWINILVPDNGTWRLRGNDLCFIHVIDDNDQQQAFVNTVLKLINRKEIYNSVLNFRVF
jgi:hypothetical protein